MSAPLEKLSPEQVEHKLQNDHGNDKFKCSFKYYKRKTPPADLSNVIDFTRSTNPEVQKLSLVEPKLPHISGLQPVKNWKVFSHKKLPGFFYISNPFDVGYQEYWIERCLRDFPCKPNLCNLDAHMSLGDQDNIWHMSQRSSSEAVCTKSKTLMDKLRWVTLGYHHNWDTKHYSADSCAPFPVDLAYLSCYLAESLQLSEDYRAEAAIINYYHMDSTLAGHTDHSEFNLEAPLFSISFGQSAIFLVGGVTKDVDPVPMYLHSGDITVMSGASRLAYHAIPRIMAAPVQARTWGSMAQVGPGTSSNSCSCWASQQSTRPVNREENISAQTYNPAKLDPVDAPTSSYKSCSICGAENNLEPVHIKTLEKYASGALPETEEDQFTCFGSINQYISETVRTMNFDSYSQYLNAARINMNVRQVFKPGQTFADTDTDMSQVP